MSNHRTISVTLTIADSSFKPRIIVGELDALFRGTPSTCNLLDKKTGLEVTGQNLGLAVVEYLRERVLADPIT